MNTLDQESVLIQMRGRVLGPFPVKELRQMQGFTSQTLVSYPGTEKWAPAFRVLKNIQAYEPPAAYFQRVDESPVYDNRPALSAVFDWKAAWIPGAWVDRWLRRIVVFNLVLALGIAAGWSRPSIRIPVQKELLRQLHEHELRWGPRPIRVVRYHLKTF